MVEKKLVELTRRERQVLGELTRDGANNQQIADRLGLSIDTVKTYMVRMHRKFEVDNRTALVVECLKGRVIVRVIGQEPSANA